MSQGFHKPYLWFDPEVSIQISEEPEEGHSKAAIMYDHFEGRLGSRARVELRTDDDDTTHTGRYTTLLGVDFIEDVPKVVKFLKVTAVLTCVEATAGTPEFETDGLDGRCSLEAFSRPFALVHPRESAIEQRQEWTNIFAYARSGGGRLNDTESKSPMPKKGDVRTASFSFTNVHRGDPNMPIRLAIGIDNAFRTELDDGQYALDFHSEWLLSSVQAEAT